MLELNASVRVGRLALVVGALALVSHPAAGQTAKEKPPAKSSQPAKAAAPSPIGWAVQCNNPGTGLKCKATQNIFITKTRQKLLSVSVSKPSGDAALAMLIQLPHGMFLPGGLSLQVDEGTAKQVAVQTCDRAGCYAGSPIDQAMLSKLESGQQLTISFQNLKKQTMRVPVPLAGFKDAVKKI